MVEIAIEVKDRTGVGIFGVPVMLGSEIRLTDRNGVAIFPNQTIPPNGLKLSINMMTYSPVERMIKMPGKTSVTLNSPYAF